MDSSIRVLYVGREPETVRQGLRGAGEGHGEWRVLTCATPDGARDELGPDIDCVLCAGRYASGTALSVVDTVTSQYPDIPVVLVPDQGGEELASEAISAGVTEYVPPTPRDTRATRLADTVADVLEQGHTSGTDSETQARPAPRAALERKRRRYDAVFEDPNILVGLVGTDGTTLEINQTALEYLDVDEAAVVGDPFWETPWFTGEVELQRRVREWVDRASAGEYVEFEADLTPAVGEQLVIAGTVRPVTDADGEVRSVLISDRDITERKRRERELEQYAGIIDNLEDLVLLVDEDRTIERANDAVPSPRTGGATTWVGHPVDGVAEALTTADDGRERFAVALETAFDRQPADGSVSIELESLLDGGLCSIQYQFTPLMILGDRYVVVVGHDVTDRKQREKQLTVLDRVLRHNLRNELNVIRGWAETLAADLGPDTADDARRIVETSNRVIATVEKERTITEILTQEPELRAVGLAALLDRVRRVTGESYPDATLSVSCPDEVSVRGTTELDRAFSELFQNGIEHDPDPIPELRVSVTVEEAVATVHVADSGPQIPEMERAVLLGTGEESPLYHGSGLGLWLVNLIVTRSGGTVGYSENDPGGNVVDIVLPRS